MPGCVEGRQLGSGFDDKLDDLQEDELDFIIEAVPTGLKGSPSSF